jgi:uncharacterized protein (TIGR00369 family)
MARTGIFWDGVAGRAPIPPAARTLGFDLVDADPEAGTITVAFAGSESFTNPFGEVLGAFLAAMLYDTLGPALLATLEPGQFIETLDLHTTFVRPATTGRLLGRGRVAARHGDLAELDGSLEDSTGHVVATATATARVIGIGGTRTGATGQGGRD